MPSIANIDYFRIRNLAVKILGLICLIGVDLARRNFWIIIQVLIIYFKFLNFNWILMYNRYTN